MHVLVCRLKIGMNPKESNPMVLFTYIRFCFINYLRQHRYIWDLIVIVLFSVFFGGFFATTELHDNIWLVFTVFAIILNLLTASMLFFLEKGNTLYFLLSKPDSRRQLFLAKIILIVLVDLFWVFLFAFLYGLRFLSVEYFMLLPLRLFLIALVLLLSTLLLSLTYTYHPRQIWLVFLLIIFGNIINKEAMMVFETPGDYANLFAFLLPPFLELNFMAVTLDVLNWRMVFLVIALLQVWLLFYISRRRMLRKDLI